MEIPLRAKYRFVVSGSHKSTHNTGGKSHHAKHSYWTTPGQPGYTKHGGKLPPKQPDVIMTLMSNGKGLVLRRTK